MTQICQNSTHWQRQDIKNQASIRYFMPYYCLSLLNKLLQVVSLSIENHHKVISIILGTGQTAKILTSLILIEFTLKLISFQATFLLGYKGYSFFALPVQLKGALFKFINGIYLLSESVLSLPLKIM